MNTIILAAGRIDYRNMAQGLTASPLLSVINGRPAISWVVGDFLKQTQARLTVVVDSFDVEMIEFCNIRYGRHDRVSTCQVENSASVLHSLLAGLSSLPEGSEHAPLRVNLGDTLLTIEPPDCVDALYLSDYSCTSANWCVASLTPDGSAVTAYFNKQTELPSGKYKALAGRYEFSSAGEVRQCLESAIREGKGELSDLLELYSARHPLRPVFVSEAAWIDFGHLEGLSKARTRLIESRCFNSLHLHPVLPEITKFSENADKLEQEAYWYSSLPLPLQSITPRILSAGTEQGRAALRMEYYGYGTLAEKFIYYNLSDSFWESTLAQIFRLMGLFRSYSGDAGKEVSLKGVYLDKTMGRLAVLRSQDDLWGPLLDRERVRINNKDYFGLAALMPYILDRIEALVASGQVSIVHGDLCFNNILFDISSGVIKLIDPRGEFGGGVKTIYGDPRYDLAKLRHSYCGNYDCIIEGDFDVSGTWVDGFSFAVYKSKQQEREALFDRVAENFGYKKLELKLIEALLFLTMIPLHQDSMKKQIAFFLTAIKKLNVCMTEEKNESLHRFGRDHLRVA